jgi:predicted DNA repair protein MutK
MASGLFALLDDVATIAKVAAASLDDIGAAASKASVKAAGVVVDDAAVTPRYVTGFDPKRELPIIWRIAKGSFFNKLVIILPILLLLSAFARWAITPILMIGGAYLCFEGAEKLWHSFQKSDESLDDKAETVADGAHEEKMVSGAIRTDLILSAEIMVIALNEVMDTDIWMRAATLALVGIGITIAVYGVVGLIVKMDDIGLAMAKGSRTALGKTIGRGLVGAMPKLLAALAVVGTAAMLWVGGQIFMHGLHEYGLGRLSDNLHQFASNVGASLPASGVWEWIVNAAGAGLFGLVLGGVIMTVLTLLPFGHSKAAH